ncbi:penicillin-binding protein [Bacillus suaedae]|uniref:serine-type D-Ala-D-Ala carboxypeptidase n=1 Tax=Halalkalibacter suaedae TaxID=2822140 RepID=A0A940X021_9BACI|nr:penicillin-binding protein [Bacillus suaedae]MBP3952131.1 penicillin-binding protein [Bacillus suaedae]
MEIKRAVTNKRAVFSLAVVLLLFFVLIGRIISIQVTKEVDGENLQAMGEARWTDEQIIEGTRGTIYDREGSALAQELTSYTVYAILNKDQLFYVRDPKKTAKLLSPHIDMDEDDLVELFTADKFQVELGAGARNLTYEKMKIIEDLELEGIFFRDEPRRYYPKQTYASHVIGYVDRNTDQAVMGIERSLDDYLRAEDGRIEFQTDGNQTPLPSTDKNITLPKNGDNIFLTLDSNIQTALEQVMTIVDETYQPTRSVAIVADPKTGEILAMSNRPSFNPNQYQEITNYLNYAIADRYEPGSTMKMFTVAAAIEEGVYQGDEKYQSGRYQIGKHTIGDHNDRLGWGTITYDEGFYRSSNVAMSKLALEKLGEEKVYEYLHKFGFDEPTGINLSGEVNSAIDKRGPVEAASTAFGQGTAVTPIQQIQAATAIANDGKMMKPYIVDRIVDSKSKQTIENYEPEVVGEPISVETAAKVKDMLEQVVISPVGTGHPYYLEGFDVIGKTGTAQIPNPNGAGYLKGHGENIFSFLGMAPKEDPRVIVYVAVERPKLEVVQAGSEPTSLIFNTIMKHSLQYLNITPNFEETIEKENEGFQTKNYTGMTVDEVLKQVDGNGLKILTIGNGKTIKQQEPLEGKNLLQGERLILRTDGDQFEMPDLTGWSNRDVRKLASVLDLHVTIMGNGFVTKQNIEPGSTIKKGEYIVVDFSPKTTTEEPLELEQNESTD